MKNVTLGATGICVPQNGFGALPIQRVSEEQAVFLLRKAYQGGIRFFDTARNYSDSEEKLGKAFGDGYLKRDEIVIATKTKAETPEAFWKDLETSLSLLKTDYVDVYQFHQMGKCYRPGDGTGLYECMKEAKKQGRIRHFGGTSHKLDIAMEMVQSGLYETVQYPFSYMASEKEIEMVRLCEKNRVGFICMKGLAGGLITNSRAAMAFVSQFDNTVPIWGIQRESELDEWLSYMDDTPEMDEENTAFIEADRANLGGDFCRSCGYCLPCTVGIQIHQCNRMSQMIRRMPSQDFLSEKWQKEMQKIEDCIECGACLSRCPYELNIPELLKKNLADYREILAGNRSVQV